VKPTVFSIRAALASDLRAVLATQPLDLARAALVIARIEYPELDPRPTIACLDDLGERGARRLHAIHDAPVRSSIAELNRTPPPGFNGVIALANKS
jgi:hypothetical protein